MFVSSSVYSIVRSFRHCCLVCLFIPVSSSLHLFTHSFVISFISLYSLTSRAFFHCLTHSLHVVSSFLVIPTPRIYSIAAYLFLLAVNSLFFHPDLCRTQWMDPRKKRFVLYVKEDKKRRQQ